MKELFLILVFAGVFDAGFTQPKMQATIKQGNTPLSVDVYIRPSLSFSNRDENIIIALALPANIKPAPSLGAAGTTVNTLGPVTGITGLQPGFLYNNFGTTMRDVAITRQAVNGEQYYLYTFVFGGTATTDHTWQKGVEQKVCTIQFKGCNANCDPGSVLLVNLPDGGAERNSYWYFQANTIADITNYEEPFYANEQTEPAVNGGSSRGSALSYLSLKLAPVELPLTLFHANTIGCNVKIDWETPVGTNAAYYAVERSENNVDYKQIFRITPSTNGTMPVSYSTMDKTALAGKSYYRLCRAGVNGKLTYSMPGEIWVTCADRAIALVTPTLGNGIINVQLASGLENAQVKAINSFGLVMLSDNSRDLTRRLNLTRFGKGAYTIQVLKDGKVVKNEKVIIL